MHAPRPPAHDPRTPSDDGAPSAGAPAGVPRGAAGGDRPPAPHCPRCGARMGALTPEGGAAPADRIAAATPDAWYCGCCGLVRPA